MTTRGRWYITYNILILKELKYINKKRWTQRYTGKSHFILKIRYNDLIITWKIIKFINIGEQNKIAMSPYLGLELIKQGLLYSLRPSFFFSFFNHNSVYSGMWARAFIYWEKCKVLGELEVLDDWQSASVCARAVDYKLGLCGDRFGLKSGSVAYKFCSGHSSLFIFNYCLLLLSYGLNKIQLKVWHVGNN